MKKFIKIAFIIGLLLVLIRTAYVIVLTNVVTGRSNIPEFHKDEIKEKYQKQIEIFRCQNTAVPTERCKRLLEKPIRKVPEKK